MKIVCIIPARGGSKRIINKNMCTVGGVPLINRLLMSAHSCTLVDEIYVSTDDEKIKDAASNYAKVLDRPIELTGDFTTSEEVILYHLENDLSHLQDNTIVLFLQCTSPFTETRDIEKLVYKITKEGYDTSTFYKLDRFRVLDKKSSIYLKIITFSRQVGNGWAFKKGDFIKERTRLYGNIGLIYVDSLKSLEIDNQLDLQIANSIYSK